MKKFWESDRTSMGREVLGWATLVCEIEESRLLLGEWSRFWSWVLGEWKNRREKKGSPPSFYHYFLLIFHLWLWNSLWDLKRGVNQPSTRSLSESALSGDRSDQGFMWTSCRGRMLYVAARHQEEPITMIDSSGNQLPMLWYEIWSQNRYDLVYCRCDLLPILIWSIMLRN